MQPVSYFSADDIDALVGESENRPDELIAVCNKSDFTVDHFTDRFSVQIAGAGIDERLADTEFPTELGFGSNMDDLAKHVNTRVGMIVQGTAALSPKLDARTAAYAVEPDKREAAMASDLAQYTAMIAHEGFDADVADRVARSLVSEKWQVSMPAREPRFTDEALKQAGKKGVQALSACGNVVAIGRHSKKDGYSLQEQFRDAMDGPPDIQMNGLISLHMLNAMCELILSGTQALRAPHASSGAASAQAGMPSGTQPP